MRKPELVRKLKDIEWEDFEVKRAKNYVPKSVWETVSAFSNTNGRYLIFGIKELDKIFNNWQKAGLKKPVYYSNRRENCFKFIFKLQDISTKKSIYKPPKSEKDYKGLSKNEHGVNLRLSWDQVGTKLGLSKEQVKEILKLSEKPTYIRKIMENLNWHHRTKFRKKYINPLLNEELIKMTNPNKPTSPKQKYMITEEGKKLLKELKEEEK